MRMCIILCEEGILKICECDYYSVIKEKVLCDSAFPPSGRSCRGSRKSPEDVTLAH